MPYPGLGGSFITCTRSIAVDIRTPTVFLSLLLSAWTVYTTDTINNDGVLYLSAAEQLLTGDWSGAYGFYKWLFFPWLIAIVSQISGLGLEASAHVLDAFLSALMAFTFVTLVRDFGGDRKTLVIAAFVILFHPYLNESRAEIIRDHGYWALYLVAVFFFIRFYHHPQWPYAAAWGATMAFATLFRIEGIALLLLLPSILWTRTGLSMRERYRDFWQAHAISGLLVIFFFVWWVSQTDFSVDRLGRLSEPIARLGAFWEELTTGLPVKAERLREAILNRYSEDFALTAVFATLLSILLDKMVRALTPLYTGLFFLRRFRTHFHPPKGTISLLIWLSFLNAVIASVFLVPTFFLSGRFIVPLILTLLLVIPFMLASVHDHWQARHTQPLRNKWIYPLTLGLLIFMTGDGLLSLGGASKAYLKEAGLWMRAQIPTEARLYTNSRKLDYYAGRPIDPYDMKGWRGNEAFLHNRSWKPYDYIALWNTHRTPHIQQQLAKIPSLELIKQFENREKDAVLIYKVADRSTSRGLN